MTGELRFPEVIDNSMRKELAKCQKIAHWRFEKGLTTGKNVNLHAGGAFAHGLEHARKAFYVEGSSHEDAVRIGIEKLMEFYGDFDHGTSNKSRERMAGALAFYFNEHRMDEDEYQPVRFPNGTTGIECNGTFKIPVLHPDTHKQLTYSFRFDLLAEDRDGYYWVVDEKTTNKLGDAWAFQWDLDSQMTGYCRGAKILLAEKGLDPEKLKGAVINGVSILKYDYGHMRCPTLRMDWEIERWYKQMVRDFEEWTIAYKYQSHRQVLDHACALYNSPCEYARLCKSLEPHKIEGGYVIHFWNPLTRD